MCSRRSFFTAHLVTLYPCFVAMPKRKSLVQQAIDDDPESKRARLQRVLNVRSTTRRSLSEILASVTGKPVRQAELTLVGQARFETMATTLSMARKGGGDSVEWELCNPNLLMSRLVSESSILQGWFAEALSRFPSSPDSPWRLLVGFDEFVPGNKLKLQNSRKCMNLVFSFVELGSALSCDLAWFSPVSVRTSVIHDVDGGWSCMLKEYLKLQLLSPNGLHNGVALDLGRGRVVAIHARLHQTLSDGEGLRMALDWMGHASTKPCFRHYNVFRKTATR